MEEGVSALRRVLQRGLRPSIVRLYASGVTGWPARPGGVSVPARQMPLAAISLCISSLSAVECAIDQMPASMALRAPLSVCTWPSTFMPDLAASAMMKRISSAV